jgi:hypothetical protein
VDSRKEKKKFDEEEEEKAKKKKTNGGQACILPVSRIVVAPVFRGSLSTLKTWTDLKTEEHLWSKTSTVTRIYFETKGEIGRVGIPAAYSANTRYSGLANCVGTKSEYEKSANTRHTKVWFVTTDTYVGRMD